MRAEPGAAAIVTMSEIAAFNCVLVYGSEAEADGVKGLLDRVAELGVPHCLQLWPGHSQELADLARERTMTRDVDLPLMVLEGAPRLVREPGDLAIKRLDPGEAEVHVSLLAAGFGGPPEPLRRVMSSAMLAHPGVVCYVGEVAGTPVTTGLSFAAEDHVGIFNVATVPAYQRRGYGAAITARAAADALQRGARWAWLQSSPVGRTVYEGLGFRTIELWEFWTAG